MGLDLKAYLEKFPDICQNKFGRTYDFEALEAYFREHATGKRHLTAKDIGKLFSAENTPFAKYWPKPHTKVLDETLTRERVYVGPLNDTGKALA